MQHVAHELSRDEAVPQANDETDMAAPAPAPTAGLAAILLHFAILFFNMLVTWLLRFPEKERKAVIMMASQKNLPTAAGAFGGCDVAENQQHVVSEGRTAHCSAKGSASALEACRTASWCHQDRLPLTGCVRLDPSMLCLCLRCSLLPVCLLC